MRTVSLRNLRAHKVRLALTVISVLLGTAFVAGSFVFTDTLKQSFDTIFATSDKGLDVRVTAKGDFSTGVSVVAGSGAGAGARRAGRPAADRRRPRRWSDDTGTKVDTGGAPSEGGAWIADDRIREVPKLSAGRAPHAPRRGRRQQRRGEEVPPDLGERVRVVVPNAAVTDATIVGVYRVSFDTGGYLGALFSRAQAMSLFTDGAHYTAVDVAAAPGVSRADPRRRVAKILPSGLEAKTGKQVRADNRPTSRRALASSPTSCSASASSPCWSARSSSTTRSR